MKVQMTGSYPYLVGTQPLLSGLDPKIALMLPNPGGPPLSAGTQLKLPPLSPTTIPLSSLRRAPGVYAFSAGTASQSQASIREKLLDGLRALSDLVTPHFGQKVATTATAIWLVADTASAVSTCRDPESSQADRLIAAGTVTTDAAALLAGILGSSRMDGAATAINFAAVVGDHVHSGQITFSASELAQFSSDPQADDASNILKLAEIVQSAVTPE